MIRKLAVAIGLRRAIFRRREIWRQRLRASLPIVTDIEFRIRTAMAMLPARCLSAYEIVDALYHLTADPRLKWRPEQALQALKHQRSEVGQRWLERAIEVHRARLVEHSQYDPLPKAREVVEDSRATLDSLYGGSHK